MKKPLADWATPKEVAGMKAEIDRLKRLEKAARTVLETFQKDEAQGYRSRERQYAIDMLGPYFVADGQSSDL
jgi:hypothetical protein